MAKPFQDETALFKSVISQVTDKDSVAFELSDVKYNYVSPELEEYLQTNNIDKTNSSSSYYEVIMENNKFKFSVVLKEKNDNIVTFVHVSDEFGLNKVVDLRFTDGNNGGFPGLIYNGPDTVINTADCYGSYSVACCDTNNDGQVSYGECFGACVGYGIDTNHLTGKFIVYAGTSSVVCTGCGLAAAFVLGVITLGCAGGCV